MFEVYTE